MELLGAADIVIAQLPELRIVHDTSDTGVTSGVLYMVAQLMNCRAQDDVIGEQLSSRVLERVDKQPGLGDCLVFGWIIATIVGLAIWSKEHVHLVYGQV